VDAVSVHHQQTVEPSHSARFSSPFTRTRGLDVCRTFDGGMFGLETNNGFNVSVGSAQLTAAIRCCSPRPRDLRGMKRS
jgi:hypothetical protein